MLERRPWGEMLGKDAADAALAGNEDEDDDEDETAAATGGSRLRWRATPLQRDAELWRRRTEDGGGSGGGGAERRLICTHDAANLCRTWLCGEGGEQLESIS